MADFASAPRGTKDVLPNEVYRWQYIENIVRQVTTDYNYREIRTPVFEHTEVFVRGVGTQTDIVQKEMYTFDDKSNRSITLKPEGTAGVVRSYIERGMYSLAQPIKMYYLTPVFRYEAPQSGRLREHHQFGVEVFGVASASMDAEIISLASRLFNKLGISNLLLNINSIGCAECRPEYSARLKDFLSLNYDKLCETCKGRFEKNPLRILDCKENNCSELTKDAPTVLSCACEECTSHFNDLQLYLNVLGIDFSINHKIVRGLDYYTKTVFEFVSTDIGAQSTVCGGGRYDGLVSVCGGPKTCGVGFGMGIERLLMVMESQSINIAAPIGCFVYITVLNQQNKSDLFRILYNLRLRGIPSDMEHTSRGLKSQFKYADKIDAKWVIIIGDDETLKGEAKLRNMKNGEELSIHLDCLLDVIEEKFNTYLGGTHSNG